MLEAVSTELCRYAVLTNDKKRRLMSMRADVAGRVTCVQARRVSAANPQDACTGKAVQVDAVKVDPLSKAMDPFPVGDWDDIIGIWEEAGQEAQPGNSSAGESASGAPAFV